MLVDTSVWVDHLRSGNNSLEEALSQGVVEVHPFVIGELACGKLGPRHEILSLLRALPEVPIADHDEVLHFLESNNLYGKGLGWVDAHLLASAVLAGLTLWTIDRRLASVAGALGVGCHSPMM